MILDVESREILLDKIMSSVGLPGIIAASLLAVFILRWMMWLATYVLTINKLPGPHLFGSGEHSHLLLGNAKPVFDSFGTVPGRPEQPNVWPMWLKLGKQFANQGLLRFWFFNPFVAPFARPFVVVFDPELARQLLLENSPILVKARDIFSLVEPLVGTSLLSLPDGPLWRHQRKLSVSCFTQAFCEEAVSVSINILENEVFADWKTQLDKKGSDESIGVDATALCTRLIMEILGFVAFGYPFQSFAKKNEDGDIKYDHDADESQGNEEESMFDVYERMITTLSRMSLVPPFVRPFHFEENRRFRKASQRLDSVVGDVVQMRLDDLVEAEKTGKAVVKPRGDLLGYLLQKDDEGRRLPFKYLFGNVRMFLFAGHDTTASTLANALWHLSQNDVAQGKLQQEVDAVYNDLEKSRTHPTYKRLKQMRYLDAIIRETLRMNPAAGVARQNLKEIRLKGKSGGLEYTIPKETAIFVFPFVAQNLEIHWKDAGTFLPERFIVKSSSDQNNAWIPFSVGPRNCVGQPLAMAELKALLAHIVRHFTIAPNPLGVTPEQVFLLNIKPHEVLIDLKPRRPV